MDSCRFHEIRASFVVVVEEDDEREGKLGTIFASFHPWCPIIDDKAAIAKLLLARFRENCGSLRTIVMEMLKHC